MLTLLAESILPEVETINTQEIIKDKRRHALRHESNDLSAGHASRNTPNVLSPGHVLQQEPIRSETETVPEGHASQNPPRLTKTERLDKKRRELIKNRGFAGQ